MFQSDSIRNGNNAPPITTGWSFLKQHIVDPVLDLVFPPVCVGCGRVDTFLCSTCIATIIPANSSDVTYASTLQDLISLGAYEGILQQAVHALKYEHLTTLARPLAEMVAQKITTANWSPGILVPVPLHETRLAFRGYNQAALLAAAIAQQLDWPVNDQALLRSRDTGSQVGLDRQARQTNVKAAFTANPEFSTQLLGADVILVDDVFTTGATINECATTLLASGVLSVRGCVIGHTGMPA